MAKQIKFTFKNKEYTLEYTRRTARQTEESGFDIQKMDSMPATMIPKLFEGAFRKHHSGIKRDDLEEIYESIPNKEGFLAALSELYAEPVEALMSEPDDKAKNVTWEKSW